MAYSEGFSPTPVIIPAYNEAASIEATLRALPADRTEPIVVVNGSSDNTAQLAEAYGAHVIEREAPGKLPAIQATLQTLGDRALSPLMILDADARPIVPKSWHNSFLHMLTQDKDARPSAVSGPMLYSGRSVLDNAAMTLMSAYRANQGNRSHSITRAGQNLGLHLKDEAVLEALLELPHYWPGEDKAILDTVLKQDGRVYQTSMPSMFVITPISESAPSTWQRIVQGRASCRAELRNSYVERGPEEAVPYIAH